MRVVTVDVETHPRFDELDCFAYFDGQGYRLVKAPERLQEQPHIDREFVVKTLREFADYIEECMTMKDDQIPDGRGVVRRMYQEGRLR